MIMPAVNTPCGKKSRKNFVLSFSNPALRFQPGRLNFEVLEGIQHAGKSMRRPRLGTIFLTVFMDLVGFGLVLPLVPIYGQKFGAAGWQVGLLMASYSAMQFLFAPVWGRLSDKIGRRPVLLGSTFCASLSYLVFGLAARMDGQTAIAMLLASRIVAGICGANVVVAQAYIADITPPDKRSKSMGLIGMAFGLGFIFGPAIGFVALKYFGHSGPGFVASSLCALNFALAFCILPESRHESAAAIAQRPRLEHWLETMRHPRIGLLIMVFFCATFCFTCYETTLGLLIGRNFSLDASKGEDARTVALLTAFGGVVGAIVQGGMIGRLVKWLGEPRLIAISLFIVGASMIPLPFFHGKGQLTWSTLTSSDGHAWRWLLVAVAFLSIGAGLTRPPLFGLISVLTPGHEQGATLGVAQSMGSLARITGPMFAGITYYLHASTPFLVGAGLSLITGVITWIVLVNKKLPEHQPAAAPTPPLAEGP